jgi:hypothetical protein
MTCRVKSVIESTNTMRRAARKASMPLSRCWACSQAWRSVPYQDCGCCAGSGPPISTTRSRKSVKLRTGIEAPRQSCTDFIPASRSRQMVSSAGSDFRSVVLPTPGGPKIASEVLFSAEEMRSSAVMMRKVMGFSRGLKGARRRG